ncbi:hypothetical protein [Cognatishimia sp.]|uniref:hypothetical protein n=1 Tax=Cognatishimia sp. TaxID=2211648 RepID=UPI003511E369
MRQLVALALTFQTTFAFADTPMSAEAFDRYTRGKTLYYSEGGTRYGAEEYLDQRRVRWSFLDGQCQEGRWFASGQDICFVYEDNPDPQCWQFFLEPGGLSAKFTGDSASTTLYEITGAEEDMLCLGPEIGV